MAKKDFKTSLKTNVFQQGRVEEKPEEREIPKPEEVVQFTAYLPYKDLEKLRKVAIIAGKPVKLFIQKAVENYLTSWSDEKIAQMEAMRKELIDGPG